MDLLKITIGEMTHTVPEWAAISGLNPATIYKRLKSGMAPEDIVRPARPRKYGFNVGETARRSGVSVGTAYARLKAGQRPDAARKWEKRTYALGGEEHTLAEWAEIRGIKYNTLSMRLRKGMPFEEAINTPTRGRRR